MDDTILSNHTPDADAPDSSHDRSLDIACKLGNVRAIADLIATVCGSSLDSSDCRIEELHADTLRSAMYCIEENITAAEEAMREQDDHALIRLRGSIKTTEVTHG